MKNKTIWVIVSCLMVAGLLLASCAPAAPTTTPTTAPTTTPTTEKPTVTEKIVTPAVPEEPEYGGTLIFLPHRHGSGLRMYDPYGPDEADSVFLFTFVYEKLVIGDWAADRKVFDFPSDGGQLPLSVFKGSLLESWEQPDPLTMIGHVRPGVRFHNKPPVNGREFTAADAVWGIDWLRKSPNIGHADDQYIESTRVLDKYTFEIKFKPPPKLENLAVMNSTFWWFIPKEVLSEKTGRIEDWRLMIGTGPFMIKDTVPGSSTTFVRNPDY